jgi:hypothetical protein
VLSDDDILLGGYRYEDLVALQIIRTRMDLQRKQRQLGFPLPVKTGKSQAWFPKAEVNAWLRMRASLRGKPPNATPDRPEHAVKPSNVLGRRKVAPPIETNNKPTPKPKPAKRAVGENAGAG